MVRRQERDLQRLFSYHQDLRHEAAARLAALAARPPGAAPGTRAGGGPVRDEQAPDKLHAEQARERARLDAIAREYQAKVEDVRAKYALRVEVSWLQTLMLIMPTQRLTVRVKRRKGERVIALDWNPIARRLDQFPCEYSYTWERPREACDAALHLVSPAAAGPCAACGRPFCRACHPVRCPKCGNSSEFRVQVSE
jgi:hypothetical protein